MSLFAKVRAIYFPPRDEEVDDFDYEPADPSLVPVDEYVPPDVGDEESK